MGNNGRMATPTPLRRTPETARVYSFTVIARIRDGVEDVQERKAYIAHTAPDLAVAEAQRVLAIKEREGRAIEWVILAADENAPEIAQQWANWHARTDHAARAAASGE